jgi:uncharacterized protein (TIGR03435 family)
MASGRLADMGRTIAGLALLALTGWGQTFEVASVRRAQEGTGNRGPFDQIRSSPDGLTMHGVRFRKAVAWAYGVMDFQVTGPDWLDHVGLDIAAKAADTVKEEDLRKMLRALLAERVKLAVREEEKETTAYVLTVGKSGVAPAVKASVDGGDPLIQPNPSKMEVTVKNAPVSQLVELLSKVLREPVVNETGLNGRYDATVNFSKYLPDGSSAPDIQGTAIRFIEAEFGLKVEHRKTMMRYIVVERAEKEPVEN